MGMGNTRDGNKEDERRKKGEKSARRFEEVSEGTCGGRQETITLIPWLRAHPIALRR